MQFAENLTDRQAADAVRGRIDWKYALGLELSDAGFNYSVLSEFRGRLLEGQAETLLLDKMLQVYAARGLLKRRGRQRTDSTHIEAAIRNLNRLELVHETLRHALNVLASVVPEWLKAQVGSDWYERYGERLTEFRLPEVQQEQQEMAVRIGADGLHLLEALYATEPLSGLREAPAVETLRRVWVQSFYQLEGQVCWREKGNQPPLSQTISSPHDPQARYSTKRDISWVGYKVHLTETCDDDSPNLITQIETRPATEHDSQALDTIHQALRRTDRLPGEHLADASYLSADRIVTGRQVYGLDLVGPVGEDRSWQARDPQGFDLSHFTIDWEQQRVTCPQGRTNQSWFLHQSAQGYTTFKVTFRRSECAACPVRSQCTRDTRKGRTLSLLPQPQFEALQFARQRQHTQDFKDRYARRAGVEGTVSQSTFTLGMRRSRYRGLAKTHLQHVATAAAMNLARVLASLADVPRSKTPISRFASLAA
jgi:transposase